MPRNFDEETVRNHFSEFSDVAHIASGGFKDVFAVREDGEEIVLKLIPIESRRRSRRARREAEAMKKLDSPNFVNLSDSFEEEIEGKRTFVMFEDLIPGQTFATKIQSGENGLELGINTTKTLLGVLEEMNSKNFIHRDIKPSNIIIKPDGEPVLLDVGIVRFEEKESLTPDHADRGPATPRYAAPEQLNNRKEEQSTRTDIFSLGIVMFESITGQHPYEGQSDSVTKAITRGEKRNLADYISNQELGEPLEQMFDIMTSVEPYQRFNKPEHALEFLEVNVGGYDV